MATAGLSQSCAGGDSSAPEPCAGDADVQGLAPVLEDPRDQWDSGLFGARCSGLGGLCPHRMKEEGLPVSGVRPAYRVTGETRLATMIGGGGRGCGRVGWTEKQSLGPSGRSANAG